MVLNQRQVLVIVSDWEPYLGSLFCVGFCGWLFLVFCLCVYAPDRTVSVFHICCFGILQCSHLWSLLNMLNSNHAALWSDPSSTEESRYTHTLWHDETTPHTLWHDETTPHTVWHDETTPHTLWHDETTPNTLWHDEATQHTIGQDDSRRRII